ncbi:MAG: YutD family protein [Aerococcus sp.]|nr:YutD family protein [Aerococcus sp.]
MMSRKEQEIMQESHRERPYNKAHVLWGDDEQLNIENQRFRVVQQKGDQALDLDALSERYMPLFDIYDFVVGDWSYGQLRLKGFYHDDTPNVPLDKTITHLPDYLLEFCSFGCDYFVLEHERTEEERREQLLLVKDKSQQNFQERKQQNKKQNRKQNNRQRQQNKSRTKSNHDKRKQRFFAIQDKQKSTARNAKPRANKKKHKKAFEIH